AVATTTIGPAIAPIPTSSNPATRSCLIGLLLSWSLSFESLVLFESPTFRISAPHSRLGQNFGLDVSRLDVYRCDVTGKLRGPCSEVTSQRRSCAFHQRHV